MIEGVGRGKAIISLGNEDPPDGLRPITARVNPRVQSLQILRKLHLIARGGLPIDSGAAFRLSSLNRALRELRSM